MLPNKRGTPFQSRLPVAVELAVVFVFNGGIEPGVDPMRAKSLLGFLIPPLLCSCAATLDPHMAQHLATIDRMGNLRAPLRRPGPPDPQRRIEVRDCTQPVADITGNLYCG